MSVLEKELKPLGNIEIARHSQGFFKTGKGEYGEGDVFLGIRVPKLREVAKIHRDLSLPEIKKSLKSQFHEVRLCGFIVLVNKYNFVKENSEKQKYYQLFVDHFQYLNNWDLVDTTCHKIIGPHLFESKRRELYQWAKSDNLWVRRVSIISTFYFIRKGQLDDSYKLAKILLGDEHDLIHKAVGWVLRECGKKDRARLEKFILTHYSKMPRTMLRYAIEKFPEKRRKEILSL